jgi:ubiquinone/menaquinone biosynthesis C-methylase UbiE/predicted transcriptional regulator
MQCTRIGPSIRDFVRYYVLVLLAEENRTKRELIADIRELSSRNRSYRSNGILWIASSEMENVLSDLSDRGFIEPAGRSDKWTITWHGRRARRRIERDNQCEAGGKDHASDKIISLLDDAPCSSYILDVGTGQGYLALKLANKDFRVLGIDSCSFDYSSDSIEKAKEQSRAEGGNVEFRQADVRHFDEPDHTFDYVVSSQAMHCMENQRESLQAIYRLLKAGGKFFCIDYLVGTKGFLVHGSHCFLAGSREQWTEMLVEYGFSNIRMYEFGSYLLIEAEKQ